MADPISPRNSLMRESSSLKVNGADGGSERLTFQLRRELIPRFEQVYGKSLENGPRDKISPTVNKLVENGLNWEDGLSEGWLVVASSKTRDKIDEVKISLSIPEDDPYADRSALDHLMLRLDILEQLVGKTKK